MFVSGCKGRVAYLLEHEVETLGVLRAEHLGDEPPVGEQQLAGKLARLQRQKVLVERILRVGTTDVRGSVVDDNLTLLLVEHGFDLVTCLVGGDITGDELAALERCDLHQIDTNNSRPSRHLLRRHLRPRTRRRAQIDKRLRLRQKVVLLVQLDQLEGGTTPVPHCLRKLIELVKTILCLLLFSRHLCFLFCVGTLEAGVYDLMGFERDKTKNGIAIRANRKYVVIFLVLEVRHSVHIMCSKETHFPLELGGWREREASVAQAMKGGRERE